MRKAINLFGWLAVLITSFALIFTLLTMYQFTYIKYFDSYYTLQWCIFFTMVIWGLKFFELRTSLKSGLYPLLCMIIAAGTMFFIYMKVY